MFKCTECDKIYDIKPDYCDDCGSDTFIEIVEEKETVEPIISQEIIKEEKIEPNKEETVIFEKPSNKKVQIDYMSWGFLGICILISLFIIFFAWNPKEIETEANNKDNSSSKPVMNIPTNVNSFWNNELPKVEVKKAEPVSNQPVAIQPQQAPVQNQPAPNPVIIPKNPEIKKPAQAAQKPVVQTKPQTASKTTNSKTTTPTTVQKTIQKPVQAVQKPVQTSVKPQTQTKPNQQQAQKTVQKPTQQPQTAQKPASQTTQPVWQSIQQQPQAQVKPAADTTALKKELANYKVALRNTIGKKIDFANVIGDGSCTVAFKIASSGKLTNRAFTVQSKNTTLNDAVYAAVMATPSYNPPPSGYNGETLYLKITFYNGNFQISLN